MTRHKVTSFTSCRLFFTVTASNRRVAALKRGIKMYTHTHTKCIILLKRKISIISSFFCCQTTQQLWLFHMSTYKTIILLKKNKQTKKPSKSLDVLCLILVDSSSNEQSKASFHFFFSLYSAPVTVEHHGFSVALLMNKAAPQNQLLLKNKNEKNEKKSTR